MTQFEMPGLKQNIQALRDHESEDHNLPREYKERRRPGRPDYVNPNLVPLLRGEALPERPLNDEINSSYGLEHATPLLGIAVSVILSIPLWGIFGLVAWAILR